MHCQLPTIALALLLGVCVAEPLSSWRSIDSIKIHTTDAIGRHLAALDPTPADFESRDRSASERFRAALAARRRPRPAAGAANASGATPIARVAPAGLRLAFEFDGRAFVYDLRPVDVFSADAAIVINDGGEEGGEHGDDEPTAAHLSGLPFGGLRTFVARGAGASGEGWARVVLEDDDSISALVFDPLAFDPADSLFALERRAVARAADEAAHAASGYARLSLEPTSTGAHARRLQTAGTILRARMSGCPPRAHLYTMRIGIVADAGYVAAVGGAAATRKKVAQMVLNTNAIFEQQVGVTFLVDKLVVNLPDVATPFPRSGPNYAPSSPGDRNTCAAPMVGGSSYSSPPHVWSGLTQPNNLVEPGIVAQAHGWMLSELSLWSAAHAPQTSTRGGPLASWHLLTNCFPPPGLVGLANQGSICTKSRRFFFEDTGAPSDPVGAWTYRLPSGNQAIPTSYSDALPCPAGWAPCTAATTLVTYTDDASVNPTWRTFAHEMGHLFGAVHLPGSTQGGLMSLDSPTNTWFYDDGTVCAGLAAVLARNVGDERSDCAASTVAICGNGRRETGEQCDDGNRKSGDGCDRWCGEEAGWRCSEAALRLSRCVRTCGNGVVDANMLEECDEGRETATCVGCRRPAGWECMASSTCCSSASEKLPVGTRCLGDGLCNALGRCETRASATAGAVNVCESTWAPFGRIWKTNTSACPLLATTARLACRPRCERTTTAGDCGLPTRTDVGLAKSYFLDGRCAYNTLTGGGGVVGHCVIDPLNANFPLCYVPTCGDNVREGQEECDDDSDCCDRATCRLKLHADCTPGSRLDVGNECCSAQCVFKPPSASCASGAGYCAMGQCSTRLPLCSAFSSELRLNTSQCPLLAGPLDGCLHRCAWRNSAHGCRTIGGASQWALPIGAVCDRGGGERGRCTAATATLGGGSGIVCAEAPYLALEGVQPPSPPPAPPYAAAPTTAPTATDGGSTGPGGLGGNQTEDGAGAASLTRDVLILVVVVITAAALTLGAAAVLAWRRHRQAHRKAEFAKTVATLGLRREGEHERDDAAANVRARTPNLLGDRTPSIAASPPPIAAAVNDAPPSWWAFMTPTCFAGGAGGGVAARSEAVTGDGGEAAVAGASEHAAHNAPPVPPRGAPMLVREQGTFSLDPARKPLFFALGSVPACRGEAARAAATSGAVKAVKSAGRAAGGAGVGEARV